MYNLFSWIFYYCCICISQNYPGIPFDEGDYGSLGSGAVNDVGDESIETPDQLAKVNLGLPTRSAVSCSICNWVSIFAPTASPTWTPTSSPSKAPTLTPTMLPTRTPTSSPSPAPIGTVNKCALKEYFSTRNNACVACPWNQVSSPVNGDACSCGAGFYSIEAFNGKHSACAPCLAGSYCPEATPESPINCPQGSIAPTSGLEQCESCGKSTANVARTACVNCPVGQEFTNDTCTPCAEGTYKLIEEEVCQPCPSNAKCLGGDAEPLADEGYVGTFNSQTGEYQAFQCASAAACPGGAIGACGENRDETSRFCSACKQDFFLLNNECRECPPSYGVYVVLGFIFFLGLLVFYMIFTTELSMFGGIPLIIVMSMQNFSIFALFRVPWPKPLRDFLELFHFTALNIDAVGPECMNLKLSYFEWWLLTMIPIALFSVAAMWPANLTAGEWIDRAWRSTTAKYHHLMQRFYWTFIRFAFIAICLKSFAPLRCQLQPDGERSIAADPNLLCFVDWRHNVLFLLAIVIGVGLHAIGLPLMIYRGILNDVRTSKEAARKHRLAAVGLQVLPITKAEFKKLNLPRKKMTKVRGGVPLSALMGFYEEFRSSPSTHIRVVTGNAFSNFANRLRPFFVLFQLVSKLALVLVADWSFDGMEQTIFALVIVCLYASAIFAVRPYQAREANIVAILNVFLQAILLLFALIVRAATEVGVEEAPEEYRSYSIVIIVMVVLGFVTDIALSVFVFRRRLLSKSDVRRPYGSDEIDAANEADVIAIARVIKNTVSQESSAFEALALREDQHVEILRFDSNTMWYGRLRRQQGVPLDSDMEGVDAGEHEQCGFFDPNAVLIVFENDEEKRTRQERVVFEKSGIRLDSYDASLTNSARASGGASRARQERAMRSPRAKKKSKVVGNKNLSANFSKTGDNSSLAPPLPPSDPGESSLRQSRTLQANLWETGQSMQVVREETRYLKEKTAALEGKTSSLEGKTCSLESKTSGIQTNLNVTHRSCRSCSATLFAKWKFCGECGASQGTPHCSRCSEDIVTGLRFCVNCGNNTGDATGDNQSRSKQTKKIEEDESENHECGEAEVSKMSTAQLCKRVLNKLNLSKNYQSVFEKEGIDGDAFLELEKVDLRGVGVEPSDISLIDKEKKKILKR